MHPTLTNSLPARRAQPPVHAAASRMAGTLSAVTAACSLLLGGCAGLDGLLRNEQREPLMSLRMDLPMRPPAAEAASAPQAVAPAAAPAQAPREERFDLVVNSASARDVFLALVTDTRYSMLLHPEVSGTLSVTLKGVTLHEALESIRDVYGYDFKLDGRRITIYPPTLQTRLFQVNYLDSQRKGFSDVRVSSGSAPTSNGGNSASANASTPAAQGTVTRQESTQISTTSKSDLWTEVTEALRGMVGSAGGRSVITSPQSGIIAVHAMPDELRRVDGFLRSMRLSIERQVVLEAKILDVELRDGAQSGIDWSVMRSHFAFGQASGYASNPLLVNGKGLPTLPATTQPLLTDSASLPDGAYGVMGLSLATDGFAAVLGFLETRGDVQVLSSPRLATLNNQKAVLKVGADEYFVTNVTGGSVAASNTSGATTTLPTVTLTPFFSGIALDVTPQIDEGNMITLHIHPSVTDVSTLNKQIDLGAVGSYKLPLAYSSVNETDTVVRIPDGNIVAIGGLMQMQSSRSRSGLPGTADTPVAKDLLGNRVEHARKRELVVLIKPTIIRNTEDWQETTWQTRDALDKLGEQEEKRRVIAVNGPQRQATAPSTAAGSSAPR